MVSEYGPLAPVIRAGTAPTHHYYALTIIDGGRCTGDDDGPPDCKVRYGGAFFTTRCCAAVPGSLGGLLLRLDPANASSLELGPFSRTKNMKGDQAK